MWLLARILPLACMASGLAPDVPSSSHSSSLSSLDAMSRRTAWEVAAAGALGGAQLARATDEDSLVLPPPRQLAVPKVRLGGGKSSLEISKTIQGHWQLSGGHGRYREPDAIDNMKGTSDCAVSIFTR